MLSLSFRRFLRHLNEAMVLKVFSSEMDPADRQSLKVPKCEIFDRVSTEVTFWHSAEYGIEQKSLQKSKNSAEFRVGGIPWTP
jgi:hypothetical protein